MGFFSGLDIEAYDRQYSDRELVRRILIYFQPHKRKLIIVACLLALIAGSSAALPILVSKGIDLLAEEPNDTMVVIITAAVAVSGIVVWGANWIRRSISARIVGDVVFTLRTDSFRAAAEHDF